ncbi:hypothetical protein E4T56_gene15564 [Termitomyces sp. T112]|nr:hypothetical protein E4T56_gene15564 [Termitomyces sp. T112]
MPIRGNQLVIFLLRRSETLEKKSDLSLDPYINLCVQRTIQIPSIFVPTECSLVRFNRYKVPILPLKMSGEILGSISAPTVRPRMNVAVAPSSPHTTHQLPVMSSVDTPCF